MLKTIITTFLVAGIIYGAAWYSIGRNDLGEIRTNYDEFDRTLQGVLGDSRELRTDSDGFARDITEITTTSRRINKRSGTINEGFIILNGDFGGVLVKVDQLEGWNRQYLIGVRDFGDELYSLRQVNKESGAQE
jgi:hypothetical protein